MSIDKSRLTACLHGGGGPQAVEGTHLGWDNPPVHTISHMVTPPPPPPSCKGDQIKITDYMDMWVTLPKRATSPAWGPPPPCKQALRVVSKRVCGY